MSTEAIGQQLRQAREARALTLEQVSRATHMRLYYLQAIEAGDLDAIPSAAQARGFLRTYAGYLGLELASLLAEQNGTPVAASDSAAAAASAALAASEPAAASAPTGAPPPPPALIPSPDGSEVGVEQMAAIFAEVGRRLQSQRELLGLSLDDVARHTHLRRHYLVALEAGSIQDLPSPVQGRGMLKNYAVFLGLDPEPLLLRFAEGLQARLAVRQAPRAGMRSAPPRRRPARPLFLRRVLSGDFLIGGSLGILLMAFIFWGTIRIFAMRSEVTPSPTARSIADVLLATPTQTATATPEPATPEAPPQAVDSPMETPAAEETAEVTLPPNSGAGVQVYVTVHQRAWMRVLVDGLTEFEGRVLPGSAYTFSGEDRVEIYTGNGAALQIFFNQQDLGLLGLFGQVVNRVYTQDGALLPTPTVTPTPTATPRLTPTPRSAATSGAPAVPVLP